MNVVAKCIKGREYIITEMIATTVSKKKWEEIKELNQSRFGDSDGYTWRYIPAKETDFSWWYRITKKLTATKIKETAFDWVGGKLVEY